MTTACPVAGLVDIESIDGETPRWRQRTSLAIDAAAYVAQHAWCGRIASAWFGAAADEFGLALVEVTPTTDGSPDRWLWATAGSAPSVYFVTDRAPTPNAAVMIAADLLQDWAQAVLSGRSRRGAFPVRQPATIAAATKVARQAAALRALANDILSEAPPTARAAATRPPTAVDEGALATVARGDLVVDNHARWGIAGEPMPPPDAHWLAAQRDRRVAAHAAEPWRKVLPLSGGSVLAPEALLVRRGRPAALDHTIAWRNANDFGRRTLRELLGDPPGGNGA